MAGPRPESSPSHGLRALLSSRAIPAALLAAAAVAAALYLAGLLPEGVAAALLAALVAAGLALLMVRPALRGPVDPVTRGVAVLIAVAAGLLCALPAITSVAPGPAVARGEVARAGDRIDLPPGALGPFGRLRLLVHAPLPPGGTPVVDFRFVAGAGPLSGQVERTVSYSRVGRGSRAAVAHDRNEAWVHGAVGPGATAVTLERVDGAVAGPLQVSVYGEWMSPLALWLASLAVLALAGFWERRLRGSHFAALAGMALAYGLLVYGNATPHAAVGTSLGAALLGALAGALAGGLAAMLARLLPGVAEVAPEAPRGRAPKPRARAAPSTAASSRRRRSPPASTRPGWRAPRSSTPAPSTGCWPRAGRPTWPGCGRSGPSGSIPPGSSPARGAWWRWPSPTGPLSRGRPGRATARWPASPAAATTTR
jgi:hypothetical protein